MKERLIVGSFLVPEFHVYRDDDSSEAILVGRYDRWLEEAETAMMTFAPHVPGRYLIWSLLQDDIVAEMSGASANQSPPRPSNRMISFAADQFSAWD